MFMKSMIGKDLGGRQEDCGSVKTERKGNSELLTDMLGAPKTWLEDKQMKLSSCKGSLKICLEDSRRVAVGGFQHFQGWKSMLWAFHPAQAQIGAAIENWIVMVSKISNSGCGRLEWKERDCAFCNYDINYEIMSLMEKKMLDIIVYQVMISAVRDDCLTNHGEDHCHED